MRIRPASLSLLLTLVAGAPLSAQTPAQSSAHIVFTFQHPQLQPSRYTIAVDENGAGRFTSEPGPPPSDASDGVFPTPVDRPIQLDDSLTADLFRYARSHSFFQTRCTRDQPNLAFTGNKTLSYAGPDGSGSCTFVWAADPVLQHISDELNAVAFTLEEGRRLDLEVQHDRLSLDAELAALEDAFKDRRASDLPNIAPELQSIADNQQVMDRARKRALALLARCQSPPKRN